MIGLPVLKFFYQDGQPSDFGLIIRSLVQSSFPSPLMDAGLNDRASPFPCPISWRGKCDLRVERLKDFGRIPAAGNRRTDAGCQIESGVAQIVYNAGLIETLIQSSGKIHHRESFRKQTPSSFKCCQKRKKVGSIFPHPYAYPIQFQYSCTDNYFQLSNRAEFLIP